MAAFQYAFRMVCIIIWKSWRTRRHQKWQTLGEILVPALLVLLLVSVKGILDSNISDSNSNKPMIYPARDMKGLIRGLCKIGCSGKSHQAYLAYTSNNESNMTILVKKVQDILLKNGAPVEIKEFENELEIEAINSYLRKNSSCFGSALSHAILIGSVVFYSDGNNTDLTYKIRLMTSTFETGKIYPDLETSGPGTQFKEYEDTGFLGLQMAIDLAYFTLDSTKGSSSYHVEMQAFPYPPYFDHDKSHYTVVIATLLPATIIIGFAYLASRTITQIVREKETGIKQYLTMLGLSNIGFWFGWMINILCVAICSICLIVTILSANLSGEGGVLVNSSISVIWTFLFWYIFAAIWFCFFVTSLVNSSSYASSMGLVLWIGTFIVPALLIGVKQRYLATQLLVAILPNMCLYWGFGIIASWEARGVGIHWDNIEDYANITDSLNFAVILSMLVFDSIFFMTITMFVRFSDKERRNLKNPYQLMNDVLFDNNNMYEEFPHCLHGKKCRYCKKKKAEQVTKEIGVDTDSESPIGILRTKVLDHLGLLHSEQFGGSESLLKVPETVEEQSLSRDCGVKVRNLTKNVQADTVLNSLSCDFYTGEITSICGEKGCGKSILLKILLGVSKADEGTAYVNHYNIHDYLTDVRRSIGICPKDDMLFEELTIMEHFLLFAWLKGKDWSDGKGQALNYIAMLKLKDKAMIQAERLSATDKRKLCLGIAIIGDPKVILLDEPTLRMDIESGKTAFNALLKIKEGKTIIMTTQSMEEADLISDRIALLNQGVLRCYGTPSYLREMFGKGYTIQLIVAVNGAEKLVRMITQEIKYAEVKHRSMTVGGEVITFIVPDLYAPLFPKIFHQLYDHKDDLGILAINIHTTSIEEIFYKVHEIQDYDDVEATASALDTVQMEKEIPFFVGTKLTGFKLGASRLLALIKKNYWMTRSNIWALVFQIFIPLALILCGITGANRGLRNRDAEQFSEININLKDYENPITLFKINSTGFNTNYTAVVGPSAKNSDWDKRPSEQVLGVATKKINSYRHQYIVGVEESNLSITALYNTVPYNAAPLSLNLVSNAWLKFIRPHQNWSIKVENQPMSNGTEEITRSGNEVGANVLIKSFCFYFAYALAIICATVALKPMKERISGSHHLQTMTGINPITFWLPCGIVDCGFVILFATIALFITFLTQELYLFTMNDGALALFLILLIGGIASLNFAYFFSQIINNAYAGFGWLNMLHLLAVLVGYLIYQNKGGINDFISELFYWVSIPFPIPLAVHALYTYSRIVIENSQCEVVSEKSLRDICNKKGNYIHLPAYACCDNCPEENCFVPKSFFTTSYGFEDYTINRDLIILSFLTLIYYMIVIFIDYNVFRKLSQYFLSAPSEIFDNGKSEKDPSAAQEAEIVTKLVGLGTVGPEDEGLLVDGMSKNYGTTGAYCNISFSIKQGECFGLLGLSGAGKTALLRALVCEELPAVGDAFLSPFSMILSSREFTSSIGYCPQENAILTDLTGLQMLQLHGSLKGICSKDLMTEVHQWLSALGLESDANRKCGDYSKGMRRRLAVAIALIGDPKVIILDDPSREIDPTGKNHLWKTLQRFKNDKIILLSSPNVQECENLCARIGLMINGRLQYVGTTSEIRKKFLNGYTVSFLLGKRYSIDDNADLELVADIKANIETILQDAVFREAYHNNLKYLIPQKNQSWGLIIEKLEKIRTSMSEIECYSMTESTLEEVFHAMTELDAESTNELTGAKVTYFQRCVMGQCCTDDFS